MTTDIPCDVSGCKYVASHKKLIVAKRMIGYHKSLVHKIRGVSWTRNQKSRTRLKKKRKSKALLGLTQVVNVHPIDPEVGHELTVSELLRDLQRFEGFLVAMTTVRKLKG